jgi:hypothetical protein
MHLKVCKKHSTYKKQQQQTRAPVEAPNGIIKSMFTQPWMEHEQQQDYLFNISCAIHKLQFK